MIFPEVELKDSLIDKTSNDYCERYIANLKDDDHESFLEYFSELEYSSLQSALVRVSYVKNIVIDGLSDHFETPTDFLFNCMRYIFICNDDGLKEHVATYVLVMDQNMMPVDDYLL